MMLHYASNDDSVLGNHTANAWVKAFRPPSRVRPFCITLAINLAKLYVYGHHDDVALYPP